MGRMTVGWILAGCLLTWLAQPVAADVPADLAADTPVTPVDVTAERPEPALLPDERDRPLRPLALIAPAALIVALAGLGLTITFRSLRDDLRKRKTVYRRRGHDPSGSAPEASS